MIKRETRKFIMAAGTVLLILPFIMPVCVFAEDSASSDYQQRMREELQNSDDFDETLAKQQEGVMQDLEALKARTSIDNRKPLVNQEDRPYFAVTPEETPVVEEPAPQPNYTYKKKRNNAVPSRSFNNVR